MCPKLKPGLMGSVFVELHQYRARTRTDKKVLAPSHARPGSVDALLTLTNQKSNYLRIPISLVTKIVKTYHNHRVLSPGACGAIPGGLVVKCGATKGVLYRTRPV